MAIWTSPNTYLIGGSGKKSNFKTSFLTYTAIFLDAFSHLYKRVCPSVHPSVRPYSVTLLFRIRENAWIRLLRKRGCQGEGEGERRGEGRGWASTDVPIALRDASDGRVSGLVHSLSCKNIQFLIVIFLSYVTANMRCIPRHRYLIIYRGMARAYVLLSFVMATRLRR